MYWPGDSKWKGCRKTWLNPKYIWREEILWGHRSNIPICCIAWYILTAYLCFLCRRDRVVLPLMFGRNGWEEFRRLDYYRCPLCRIMGREVKILWGTDK